MTSGTANATIVPQPATASPREAVGLKEWAVAVRALDAGEQVLILRKGGISEERKEFLVEHEEFFLYPTYEHQQRGQMQEGFHDELARTLAAPRSADRVLITNWARVAASYPVTDEATADALAAHTLWTPEYIRERLHWRPKKPLYAIVLRVGRLREPRAIPYRPEYGGCKSWLALDEGLTGVVVDPVLDDAAFGRAAAPLHALLQR
jgi:hypothetical protein